MGTTIKDIAERAEVSIATVSLVMNNKGGVGEATRRRVLKLAQEMDYSSPSRPGTGTSLQGTVRFLKIARHGHTVNRDHNVFISEYIDGIVDAAKELHYRTEVATFRTTPIEQIAASLEPQGDLSGAVVLGTELTRHDVALFQQAHVPLVFIDTFLNYIPFDFVDMNNIDSVFRVVEHLLQFGHRDIGIVRSTARTRNFILRDTAFNEVMRALGLPVHRQFVFSVDSTYDGAYQDMRRCLRDGATLPTALFCTNDIIAFGVLKALRDHGVRVPEDVSVVGFDDLPTAALMDPPLTTIAVFKREIGFTAIRRLDARIRDNRIPPAKIVVGGTLIERESVARVGTAIHTIFHDPEEEYQ